MFYFILFFFFFFHIFKGWESAKKRQPTSVRIPAGELLSVWVSESEENIRALNLSLFLSPSLSVSPSLSSSLLLLGSLPPSRLLHHFSAGVRTQPSIGKLQPPPSPPPPPCLLRASLVIGINTWKLNGCTDLCPQKHGLLAVSCSPSPLCASRVSLHSQSPDLLCSRLLSCCSYMPVNKHRSRGENSNWLCLLS